MVSMREAGNCVGLSILSQGLQTIRSTATGARRRSKKQGPPALGRRCPVMKNSGWYLHQHPVLHRTSTGDFAPVKTVMRTLPSRSMRKRARLPGTFKIYTTMFGTGIHRRSQSLQIWKKPANANRS